MIQVQLEYRHCTSWHDLTSTSHDASHLTVTASHCGHHCHDSSFTVTVTLLSFTVTLSDLRLGVSQSRPRLGAPGRPAPGRRGDRLLLGPAAQRRRPWPAETGQMLGGGNLRPTRHSDGRQQFLKQEFSWKKRETFALLNMRSSLAAASGSGSASEEAAARLLVAAERLRLGAASRPSSAASSRGPSDNFKFKSS